jgi:hypothetical protein
MLYKNNNSATWSKFPIAIGKKNSNHQCVEKLFSDEMTELRSGSTKYSSRWGFTGDLATVAHHIPSCVACVR